MTHNIIMFR